MVALALHNRHLQEFLPLYKCIRRWSDRFKEVDLPLFPGYVFCRFDHQERLPVLTTPGVYSIVGIGRAAVPVDDKEIAGLQTVMESGLPAEPWPFLRAGQTVHIDAGPLAGLEGILTEVRNRQRLAVSVSLLQRSVAVEIDRCWVTPVIHPAARPPAHALASYPCSEPRSAQLMRPGA